MQLIIMRHGEAEPVFANDPARKLTTRGFMECQRTGVWLQQQFGTIDYALVSPYERAKQSFDMVKSMVAVDQVEESTDIIPSGNPNIVQDYVDVLRDQHDLASILLVSHMPIVSYMVDTFCGRLISHLFSTASIAVLDYDPETRVARMGQVYTPNV